MPFLNKLSFFFTRTEGKRKSRLWQWGLRWHRRVASHTTSMFRTTYHWFRNPSAFVGLQPIQSAYIMGGILIGPSFLGRNKMFTKWVFPDSSKYMIETASDIGALIFLFLSGVKQDPSMLKQAGRKAVVIAISGFILTIASLMSTASILGKYVIADLEGINILWALSTTIAVTNFPVAHPILVELNLLNCDLGRLAMAASMVTDLIAWVLFVLSVSVRHGRGNALRMISFVGSLASLIIVIIYVIRPVMKWIVRKTPNGRPVEKRYIAPILLSAFIATFISDFIGATTADGPLFLGLAIPDGLPLGAMIVRNFETVNNIFLLPFYFSKEGFQTNLFSVPSWKSWWAMQFILCSGYVGKTVGTILACLFYKMPCSDSISLGLVMNFRGIIELFSYENWLSNKYINISTYSALAFSTVMITAVTTPLVSILNGNSRRYLAYNRRTFEHSKSGTEIGILTCVHGDENIPSIINLLEASNSTRENPISAYAFHLLELFGRSIPVFVAHDSQRKSSYPTNDEHFVKAFRNYEKYKGGQICIQSFTIISPYKSMHEDICKFALDKKVKLIIIPFHKQRTITGNMDTMDNALRTVNPNILENAPCSVGVLVDRGGVGNTMWATQDNFSYSIAIIFLGGNDDREVLAYASRMAEHPQVSLTVVRFLQTNTKEDSKRDMQFDDKLLEEFRYRNAANERVVYREEVVQDGPEMVTVMRSMGNGYDLMMTGRKQSSKSELLNGLSEFSESPELGVVGDILASPDFLGGMVSVLVVQQQLHMRTLVFKI
ncbi:cation/H(+) antiporter 15-like isoform X2 [Tasmannia lanceolata]|uniref:cation/H(+) antiporter 15-like isoform X2 n=1 Tax=Tasmannia lanceolata TaxID=3420 RepID=UPI0040648C8F